MDEISGCDLVWFVFALTLPSAAKVQRMEKGIGATFGRDWRLIENLDECGRKVDEDGMADAAKQRGNMGCNILRILS